MGACLSCLFYRSCYIGDLDMIPIFLDHVLGKIAYTLVAYFYGK
jgi:hypothetical protein